MCHDTPYTLDTTWLHTPHVTAYDTMNAGLCLQLSITKDRLTDWFECEVRLCVCVCRVHSACQCVADSYTKDRLTDVFESEVCACLSRPCC
jgi:hypothetical protein